MALHPPEFVTVNVYVPVPETEVLDEVGEEIVDPDGPVHVYVGEVMDVLPLSVTVDDPQEAPLAEILAVGVPA